MAINLIAFDRQKKILFQIPNYIYRSSANMPWLWCRYVKYKLWSKRELNSHFRRKNITDTLLLEFVASHAVDIQTEIVTSCRKILTQCFSFTALL